MRRKHRIFLTMALIALLAASVACGSGEDSASPPALQITIEGHDIKFDKTSFTVKVGQPVTITLINKGALEHSLLIDEFNVKIQHVQPGQTGSATFTPRREGTYTYYCDVPGHVQAKMVGTLTVTP
jgi:plastocyanin